MTMATGEVLIGWAGGEMSPPRKTFVMGQFHTRISDEIRTPLMATALALEVGDQQVVMLTCDIVSDSFRADVQAALAGRCPGLDPEMLTIACTHTHNSPATTDRGYHEPADDPDFMGPHEYRRWLAPRLAEIVEAAWTARAPGGIARGFGYAVVGRNRRATYTDGTGRMYGTTGQANFEGLEATDDHAVNMLYTHDAAGKLTGMVVNLACPSQCEESGEWFSADFWHPVREGIAERHGPDVHLLSQCAPAGDLSPHLMTDHTEEADLRNRLGTNDTGIIARRILTVIEEGLATASPIEKTLRLEHQIHTWKLPRIMVTKEEYELEKRIPEMSDEERAQQPFAFQRLWPFGPICDLIGRYENQDANPDHIVHSHVIRIGDVVMATNPFELFVDYSHRIKCRSRALQTFLVQLADESGNGFYLPTRRAQAGGHYSAVIKSNWVGPEGGDKLVEHTVDAINALFADAEYPRTR
jgi:hypothetical protein